MNCRAITACRAAGNGVIYFQNCLQMRQPAGQNRTAWRASEFRAGQRRLFRCDRPRVADRAGGAGAEPGRAPRRRSRSARISEAATRLTIAELAARAGVSQPTVTRFCRSVGSSLLQRFQDPARHHADRGGGLSHLRPRLRRRCRPARADRDDARRQRRPRRPRPARHGRRLRRPSTALAASRRIDIYGQGGGSAAVVEDAKLRLFRLGIPVSAFVDGHQQRMSAATLRPGDAVLRHLEQRPLQAGDRRGRDRPLLRRDHHRPDPARHAARRRRPRSSSPSPSPRSTTSSARRRRATPTWRSSTPSPPASPHGSGRGPRRAPPRPLRRDPDRRRDSDADHGSHPSHERNRTGRLKR